MFILDSYEPRKWHSLLEMSPWERNKSRDNVNTPHNEVFASLLVLLLTVSTGILCLDSAIVTLDRGTLKGTRSHDKHLGENARRDNGGNLSCPDSAGRSEPQLCLIYSQELCSALSGPVATFLSLTKACWTVKQPPNVMFKTFLIPVIKWHVALDFLMLDSCCYLMSSF